MSKWVKWVVFGWTQNYLLNELCKSIQPNTTCLLNGLWVKSTNLFIKWVMWVVLCYSPIYIDCLKIKGFDLLFNPNTNMKPPFLKWSNKFIIYTIFFFFWHVHTKGGWEIQINNICFIKCGPQPIELSLKDTYNVILTKYHFI